MPRAPTSSRAPSRADMEDYSKIRCRVKESTWRYLVRKGMSYDNAIAIVQRFIENLHIVSKARGVRSFRVWPSIRIATLPDGTNVDLTDIPAQDRSYIMQAAVNNTGLQCRPMKYNNWIVQVKRG